MMSKVHSVLVRVLPSLIQSPVQAPRSNRRYFLARDADSQLLRITLHRPGPVVKVLATSNGDPAMAAMAMPTMAQVPAPITT
jgi:hypothetical protein